MVESDNMHHYLKAIKLVLEKEKNETCIFRKAMVKSENILWLTPRKPRVESEKTRRLKVRQTCVVESEKI